jgi:hypothetical protein
MPVKNHYPPSRIKYNQTHPTITVRVNAELASQLKEIKKTSGKSIGDILREAVGTQKRSTGQSYNIGYAEAKATYLVTFRCHKCNAILEVNSDECKKAAGTFLTEHGWSHQTCL